MAGEYDFTGIGSGPDDGGHDFDGLMSCEQHPLGEDPMSLGGMNQASEADRAVRDAVRYCAKEQGGTSFDNDLDELSSNAPPRTEAEDLVQTEYFEEMYPTSGEYQQRQWNESDNTGEPPPEINYGVSWNR